jgi:hypothetical protein
VRERRKWEPNGVGPLAGVSIPALCPPVSGLTLVLVCVAQFLNPVLLRVEDKAWLEERVAKERRVE